MKIQHTLFVVTFGVLFATALISYRDISYAQDMSDGVTYGEIDTNDSGGNGGTPYGENDTDASNSSLTYGENDSEASVSYGENDNSNTNGYTGSPYGESESSPQSGVSGIPYGENDTNSTMSSAGVPYGENNETYGLPYGEYDNRSTTGIAYGERDSIMRTSDITSQFNYSQSYPCCIVNPSNAARSAQFGSYSFFSSTDESKYYAQNIPQPWQSLYVESSDGYSYGGYRAINSPTVITNAPYYYAVPVTDSRGVVYAYANVAGNTYAPFIPVQPVQSWGNAAPPQYSQYGAAGVATAVDNRPIVSLSQIPYTGIDSDIVITVLEWMFFLPLFIYAAYIFLQTRVFAMMIGNL